jgi:hypothetical protein
VHDIDSTLNKDSRDTLKVLISSNLTMLLILGQSEPIFSMDCLGESKIPLIKLLIIRPSMGPQQFSRGTLNNFMKNFAGIFCCSIKRSHLYEVVMGFFKV